MGYIKNFIRPRSASQTESNVVVEVDLPVIPEGLPSGGSKSRLMVKRTGRQDYSEYLEGDSWRCCKSPSKAHHWIVGSQTICKYCLTAKQPQTE
jgi:hypothetical protein